MGPSPSKPAECICGTRFCRYNRSEGMADPKTPDEPEKIDAIKLTTDAVADFMGKNCKDLYKQAKDRLETISGQPTEGTVTCLSTENVYASTTDNKEAFKHHRKKHITPINVCALVASIVALLVFAALMVLVYLYCIHRKAVTKTVDEERLTEPLSSP